MTDRTHCRGTTGTHEELENGQRLIICNTCRRPWLTLGADIAGFGAGSLPPHYPTTTTKETQPCSPD